VHSSGWVNLMVDLPSGTVTFLFTDVEGSTILLRRLRAGYGEVLSDHQRLLREAVAEAGGDEIDSQGDSFFFVFRRARDAVLAAANAQRALAAHAWPEDGAVRVRMGIHTGEAAVVDGRYLGVAVHRAARISSAGHGGQVLLSQTTHNLLEDEEELPLELRDLGEQRLKDFERPVRVYQLVIPGLPDSFPPLTTLDREPETVKHAPPELPLWRRLTRRQWLAGAVAGGLAAAAVATALALTLGGSGSSLVASRSIGIIDPNRNAVVADVHLSASPSALTSGENGIWAVSTDAKTLTKVDPHSRKVAGTVALPGIPSDVAAGDGAVWVLHSSSLQPTSPGEAGSFVSRINPRLLGVLNTIDTGGPFDDTTYSDPIAVGRGVWLAATGATGTYGLILRIDPADNELAGHVSVRGGVYGAQALAADDQATWAVTGQGVIRIDPRTKGVTEVQGPGTSGPAASTIAFLIAVGEGKVWVAGESFKPCGGAKPQSCRRLPGVLWRIDPGTNGVDAQTPIGLTPSAIAVGAGAVWVGDRATKSVWRIDPSSLKVVKKIEIGNAPVDLAVAGGAVWVAVG
jgi:class 3 adenylate cyclase